MDTQHFKNLLRSRALKATATRLNLLVEMEQYASAMPYSAIQAAFKSTDRVTLYRTLESLKEQGIIHKAFQENNDIYYALCGKKCDHQHHHHDHIHFKCTTCETVTCQQPNEDIKISIPDHEIHKVAIHVEGICRLCRN